MMNGKKEKGEKGKQTNKFVTCRHLLSAPRRWNVVRWMIQLKLWMTLIQKPLCCCWWRNNLLCYCPLNGTMSFWIYFKKERNHVLFTCTLPAIKIALKVIINVEMCMVADKAIYQGRKWRKKQKKKKDRKADDKNQYVACCCDSHMRFATFFFELENYTGL